ncbi:MAG: SusC/RagA family TonB-linked outer membrane protein [Tannerellaceae bacterium]|nr:SusC/RagA family TonB-linked outer membrane protein [Tannerellaceae bacterium]
MKRLRKLCNVRFVFVLLCFTFLFMEAIWANSDEKQQDVVRITGMVVSDTKEPLIGAVVRLKGGTVGSVTDMDGRFTISVPPNSTLVVQYLGFSVKEVRLVDSKPLTIVLSEESTLLSEVTVTALGISREKKSLGYAIGEVKGNELEKAKETNLVNALAGKVAGLVISQTAGGPSGSTRVLIRGNTELTGNNEPLYVVDGIPLDNTNFGSADTWGGFDLGNGVSNINPDDIENISILKGPSASALYGSRASHGVILITTKKASGSKSFGLEVNSTFTAEKQLTRFDVQSLYGQGGSGRINGSDDVYTSSSNWGPKIDEGLTIIQFDGIERPYKFIEGNVDGFFRTGLTATNTVVLNSVTNNTGVRLSLTNMENQDIVPNTDMARNSVNLRATSKYFNRLDVDVKMNYVREDVKNRPALSGSGTNVGKNLMTIANTFDHAWLKNSYINERGEYYDWNNNDMYNLNPYWVIYAMENNSVKDRFSGSGALNFKFDDRFNLRFTAGGEMNLFEFKDYAPYSTPGRQTGELNQTTHRNYVYNAELLLSYKDKIGLFDVGVNAGGNVLHINNKMSVIRARDMQLRETVNLQSFFSKETSEGAFRKQINSLFAMPNIGFNDYLYLDATIRTDMSSTLPTNNKVYTYPSGSLSFIFSEALGINSKILSFGKLRASAAQVGSDTSPFQLQLNYSMPDKPYLSYPYATVGSSRVPNKDLKPTRSNSLELGLDLKFLKNRISLDVTYYMQDSKDQILFLPISNASSYNEMLVNAGSIKNKGIEIALGTRPIALKDFSWDLNFNFARNENTVTALTDDLERFTLAKAEWLDVTIDAVTGEKYGSIVSSNSFLYNDAGQLIVNAQTGLPEIPKDRQYKVLGNAMWDWTGGLTSSFRYKNLFLSAIFDVKVGADLYSMTARSLYTTGKSKATLEHRDAWYESEEKRIEAGVINVADWTPTGGYLVEGVNEVVDESGNITYKPNTRYVDPQAYWGHVGKNDPSFFIFDNSYVKVREITLTYQFPKKIIEKFAEALSISFVSRNPFILYKNIPNIDPDSNYNNSSGLGLEYGSLPSRRSLGFNINVKF